MGVLVALSPLLLTCAFIALKALARAVRIHRQLSAELTSDWWTRFENEFRTYARGSWRAAREAERRA